MDAGSKCLKDEFEQLLAECRNPVERFVFYKVDNKPDGEDIVYLFKI